MTSTAKRPRHFDDYDAAYYDNVSGTSMTRTSVAPNGTAYLAPNQHPAYSSSNGLGGATSPLLTSRLPAGQHLSPHAEDDEDMAAPKSASTTATRAARGRGRGRPRGRGRGRGVAAGRSVDASHYYDDMQTQLPADEQMDEDEDDDSPPNPLTFQCRTCFRLLGDSLSFVATDTELGYVILSSVTEVVAQSGTYETSTEPGKDIGSTFARLRCAGCNTSIGRNYRTTPRDLDDLRDCFSLEVDAVFTYQLGSNFSKQLEADDEAAARRESGSSRALGTDGALESKMERTRALTIELSDRLIKAEEDIRRYSALVNELMQKQSAESKVTSLPTPEKTQEADEPEIAAPEVAREHEEPSAPAPAPAPAGEAEAERVSTPPSPTYKDAEPQARDEPPTPPLKQESQTSSQKVPQTTYTSRPRRSGATPNLPVLMDSSNDSEHR